jgi:hypothetical protein
MEKSDPNHESEVNIMSRRVVHMTQKYDGFEKWWVKYD